jgi:hypothetical protein
MICHALRRLDEGESRGLPGGNAGCTILHGWVDSRFLGHDTEMIAGGRDRNHRAPPSCLRESARSGGWERVHFLDRTE